MMNINLFGMILETQKSKSMAVASGEDLHVRSSQFGMWKHEAAGGAKITLIIYSLDN